MKRDPAHKQDAMLRRPKRSPREDDIHVFKVAAPIIGLLIVVQLLLHWLGV